MIEVLRYQREDGFVPLNQWLAGLRDDRARVKLEKRIQRVALGIFGDIKTVGEGVLELREDMGSGYRIYLGRHGPVLVILLVGGKKDSQQADIERAEAYWQDWNGETHEPSSVQSIDFAR